MLLLSILVLSSCETFNLNALRGPASVKPKHYIVTLHGLNGAPESFAALLPVLEVHLSQINPNYEVVTKNFKYSSGLKEAEIERFVSEYENFLSQEIPVLNDGDKISMIAHSQGGLVSYIWYLKTLDGVDLRQRAYMERIDGFVTLGAPFWGSDTTYILKKFIPIDDLKDFVFDKMHLNGQESIDIASASEKIYGYFSKMAQKSYVNFYYDPRMLNLSAVVPAIKGDEAIPKSKFFKFITSMKRKLVKVFDYHLNVGTRWESDQVVNVASSRLGFYYYSDAITRHVSREKRNNLVMDDFDYSRFFKTDPKFILVEGVHNKSGGYGDYAMAAIPEKCVKPDQCKHPTYVHILKHLANCESAKATCQKDSYMNIVQQLDQAKAPLSLETNEMLRKEMRTFNLGLDLQLPKNFVPPKEILESKNLMKYLQVNYVYGNDNKKHEKNVKNDGLVKNWGPFDYEIRVGRLNEWGSRIVNYSADKNKLQIQLTGSVQPIATASSIDVNRKYPLQMVINIPGLKKRKLVIPLQPTYTTFLDLQLD